MKRLKFRFGLLAATLSLVIVALGGAGVARADSGPDVIGGQNATEQYGAVSLWLGGQHHCTAALITPEWALTAAHCQPTLVPGQTEVRASSRDNTSGYENVGLAAFYVNPNYDSVHVTDDLALIHFQHPVQNSQPLSIAANGPSAGTLSRIAGWGVTCQDAANPACNHPATFLQQLDTKVLPNSECQFSYNPDGEICTVAADGQTAMACFGDSGGPQVQRVQNNWVLTGITSHDGEDSGNRKDNCSTGPGHKPGTGVWMKVSHYIPWITNTMTAAGATQLPVLIPTN